MSLSEFPELTLSLQTGGIAQVASELKRLTPPPRTIFVYGGANNLPPNFDNVSGAVTYANSLTPTLAEPVVVRMYADADGEPYTLAGLDPWIDYANDGIYFVSDFVRLNTSTTLPTTLPPGLQVWYIDPNGVETLWVGHEDGSAWPSVGYKEYDVLLTQAGTNAPVATVGVNTVGVVQLGYSAAGTYSASSSIIATSSRAWIDPFKLAQNTEGAIAKIEGVNNGSILFSVVSPEGNVNDELDSTPFNIRVYP
jgi:hypothetical protein